MAGETIEASTLAPEAPQPLTQDWIDQRIFDLYDEYCHGQIDRREFLARSAAVTIGGLAMAQALLPRYAQAQTISFTDTRIKARYVTYPSPGGTSGTMRGYLVLAGYAVASMSLVLAAVLVAGGGLIAARDMIGRKKSPDVDP